MLMLIQAKRHGDRSEKKGKIGSTSSRWLYPVANKSNSMHFAFTKRTYVPSKYCPEIVWHWVPRGSKSACKVDQAGSMKNGTRKTRANNEKTAKRTKKAVV